MKNNLDYFITLLLIKNVKKFRNSYSLAKVLAWKFDIIEFVRLINVLAEEGLIKIYTVDGINNYEITKEGEAYLMQDFLTSKRLILAKYADERDFLNTMFNNEDTANNSTNISG